MAIGHLQIQTRTAQDAIPLEGARILVLDDEGNALYRLVTDESGETQAVLAENTGQELFPESGLPREALCGLWHNGAAGRL